MWYGISMPVRNTVRVHSPDTFYHIYNRGIEGRQIFCDEDDYDFFLRLFERHLSLEQQITTDGNVYKHFRGRLDAVSYTHLRAHETRHDLVCRLLLEKK